jgi:hypothetical protein
MYTKVLKSTISNSPVLLICMFVYNKYITYEINFEFIIYF